MSLQHCVLQNLVPTETSSFISHHPHALSLWSDPKCSFQQSHAIPLSSLSQISCKNTLSLPLTWFLFFQIQVSSFLRESCLIQVQVELYTPPLNFMKSYDFQAKLLLSLSFSSRPGGIKESSGLSLLSH